jgi:hypothetical protein
MAATFGRTADQPNHLGFDVLLLEEPALDRHEIGQRRAHGKNPDFDLVLRRGGRGERRQHGQRAHGATPARCKPIRGNLL